VDNDGWPEIVNEAHSGYWALDKSTKALQWRDGTFPPTTSNPTGNHKLVFDYNSDGHMDLLVGNGIYDRNGRFEFTLYRNMGDGTFSDATQDTRLAEMA